MNKRRQSGAAMVELAILVFLMVLLFVGMAELGRALYFQQKLTKSVEGAARYLARSWDAVTPDCATGPAWDAAIVNAANIAVFGAEAGGTDPAIPELTTGDYDFAVEPRAVTGITGSVCVVRAEVTTNYRGIFFIGGGILPPPIMGGGAGAGAWQLHAVSEERYVGD